MPGVQEGVQGAESDVSPVLADVGKLALAPAVLRAAAGLRAGHHLGSLPRRLSQDAPTGPPLPQLREGT